MRTTSWLAGASVAFGLISPGLAAPITLPSFDLEPVDVGTWVAGTFDPDHFGGGMVCLAYTYASDRYEALFVGIGPDGFQFGFNSPALDPYRAQSGTRSQPIPLAVEVDGSPVELAGASWSRRGDVLWLTSAEGDGSEGSLERGIRHGQHVVLGLDDHRSTFALPQIDELMRMLTQCRDNDGAMPSSAASDEQLAEWRAAEDGEEEPAGAFDAGASADYFDGEPAFAQMRCFIDQTSLFGLWGQGELPLDVTLAIDGDGNADINSRTLEPVHVRQGSTGLGPDLVVYRARDLLTASQPAHLNAPTTGLSPEALNAVVGVMMEQAAQMIPAGRIAGLSIVDEEIVFLDQQANGAMTNVGTSECYRVR